VALVRVIVAVALARLAMVVAGMVEMVETEEEVATPLSISFILIMARDQGNFCIIAYLSFGGILRNQAFWERYLH
jgi:hypothetical protein